MAGREVGVIVAASTSNIHTDEETHSNGSSPLKTKKRKRDEQKWQRNVRRRSILRGVAYVSTSGKLIPARTIAPDCPCKRKCTSKFSKEMKENFLEAFHNMKDKVSQDAYLSGLISCHNIQRRRPDLSLKWTKNKCAATRKEDSECDVDETDTMTVRNRASSFRYKVNIAGSEFVVCKAGFCALHGINKSRVERLAQHKRNNITSPTDRRGKHTTRPNKMPVDTVEKVILHIKSFPVRASHYSRQPSKKKYLNPDLNVNKMYHLYLEKHEPEAFLALKDKTASIKPSVTYEFYLRTFNTKFNYSFGYPRSDTCEVCDALKLKLEKETDQEQVGALEAEKLLHLRKAQHFYEDVTQEAQNDPTIEGLCFDYQQNLPVPVLTTGELFYLRQVWVYNIGFYSCKTGCSKMYMFDETTGRKGSNKTVSLLKHYIDNYITDEVKTLHLFSDNCAGQNKNILMVQFLSSVCAAGKFIKIHHHFPEPGHSFMPCDRAFAQIEKVKRRKEYVYVPEEWYDIVSSASKNFSVVRVQQEMLLDFKRTLQPLFKRVMRNATDSFRISRYRKFIYEGKEVSVSPEQNSLFFSKFCLFKSMHLQPNFSAPRLYASALPLDYKKYDDVMKIVQKYVPPVHIEYYKQLTSNRLKEQQGTDSDVSYSV